MMKYALLLSTICFSLSSHAQEKGQNEPKTFKMAPMPGQNDSITMKQYYFVMLTKGSDRDKITDKSVIEKLQQGHLANITKLAKEGKILVAGPFGDDGNWRGIFIFNNCSSKEEVESLLNSDPMIKAGRLSYEVHPWWTGMNCVFK